jgi:hypothetical protein
MGNKYAAGYKSIAECDRCGFRYKLKELRKLVVKGNIINAKVCKTCWDPDHPQLKLGLYPVDDPQAVREPRPDHSYYSSGTTGLQLPTAYDAGLPGEGSRMIQWGWNPVGGASANDAGLTPNYLTFIGVVGNVTITIS